MSRKNKVNDSLINADFTVALANNENYIKEYALMNKNGKCQSSVILTDKRLILDVVDRDEGSIVVNRQEIAVNDISKLHVQYDEQKKVKIEKASKAPGIFVMVIGVLAAIFGILLFIGNKIEALASIVEMLGAYKLYVIIGAAVLILLSILLMIRKKKTVERNKDFKLLIYSNKQLFNNVEYQNYQKEFDDNTDPYDFPIANLTIAPDCINLVNSLGADIIDAQHAYRTSAVANSVQSVAPVYSNEITATKSKETEEEFEEEQKQDKNITKMDLDEIKDEDLDKISSDDLAKMISFDSDSEETSKNQEVEEVEEVEEAPKKKKKKKKKEED